MTSAKWTALLLATTALATPALAQSAGPLDEVIVTATKRSANLQDVPVSVQALGAQTLEELHISDFTDYAAFLPSVSFSASYGPGFNRPIMRGVASGDNGNHSSSLPSVGVYLGEQPITTITGALDLHIYDIARVEVLSGPQGTLYGASSESGTIRIIPNDPDPGEFSAAFDAEVNTVEDGGIGNAAEGYVNIPITQRAALRMVGWWEHDAGYIDNVHGTRLYPTSGVVADNAAVAEDDYNDVDTYGARAALKIDLNEHWTLTPSVMGQMQRSHGVFGFDPQIGDLDVQHYFPEWTHDSWAQAALTAEGSFSNLDFVYTGAYLVRDQDYDQDYSDYGYFYDTYLGSGAYFVDNSFNPINPAQFVEGRDHFIKETHELRLSSPQGGQFDYLVGAFYSRQEHQIHQRYIVDGLNDAHQIPNWDDTIWLTEQTRIDRDYALFGEATFHFTERLSGTFGLRIYHYSNTLEGFYGYNDAFPTFGGFSFPADGMQSCFPGSPAYHGAPCIDLAKFQNGDGETHRFNLAYKFDDDRMIYATYSTGFRPGGINRRGSLPPYDADELSNYEFGWKTTWADGALRWNGAIYWEDWTNFQFSFLGANGLTEIQNAGDASIYGLESDVAWAPNEHFTLTGAISLLHAEMTKTTAFAPEGAQLPIAPEVKANLTARYEFTLGDWNAFVQGSAVYQGESTLDVRPYESSLFGTLPSFSIFNASTGVERGGYRFQLFVNNVFDERAILSRYTECKIETCFGLQYDVPSQPRTIGIRIGADF